jgi:hypothetical protein
MFAKFVLRELICINNDKLMYISGLKSNYLMTFIYIVNRKAKQIE